MDEYLSISSVSIPDQVTRDLLPAARLSELIGGPFGRRMRGHPKERIRRRADSEVQTSTNHVRSIPTSRRPLEEPCAL